jgi:hypothetical protein
MSGCYTIEKMAARFEPGKSADDLSRLLRHLASCESCQQQFRLLPAARSGAASFLAGLKEKSVAEAAPIPDAALPPYSGVRFHPRVRLNAWQRLREALNKPVVRQSVAIATAAAAICVVSLAILSPVIPSAQTVFVMSPAPVWSPGIERALLISAWGLVAFCAVVLLATARTPGRRTPPAWVEATGPGRHFVTVMSEPALWLGRSLDCRLLLDTPEVSRNHAEILWSGGKFVVNDLGSKNGTRVNGQRIDTAELSHGDVIEIGAWRLVFSQGR